MNWSMGTSALIAKKYILQQPNKVNVVYCGFYPVVSGSSVKLTSAPPSVT